MSKRWPKRRLCSSDATLGQWEPKSKPPDRHMRGLRRMVATLQGENVFAFKRTIPIVERILAQIQGELHGIFQKATQKAPFVLFAKLPIDPHPRRGVGFLTSLFPDWEAWRERWVGGKQNFRRRD